MAAPVRRLPYVLLGLMTLASFGGPFGIVAILQGGERPGWPPDRPVEWVAFAAICGLVAALMIACLALGLANRTALGDRASDRRGP